MHEIMVRTLPTGCRLTAIFDASSSLFIICTRPHSLKISPVTPALHWVSSSRPFILWHRYTNAPVIDLPYVVRLCYLSFCIIS